MNDSDPGVERFNALASQWDANPVRVALAHALADRMLERVPFQDDDHVLDYGAGTGLVALRLLPRVASVTAMDSSPNMLGQLQAKATAAGLSNLQAIRWDLEQSEWVAATRFSHAVSAMAFHHIADTRLVLRRLRALLRPGGWCAVADLDEEPGTFHGDAAGIHHLGFPRGEMVRDFVDAGFEQVAIGDAYRMEKPDASGRVHAYTIFLATGVNPAG